MSANDDLRRVVFDSSPEGIERSEKMGQQQLATDQNRIPIQSNRASDEVTRETGILFGDLFDDLFVMVQLPAGWRIVATEHSMWSDLVDDTGTRRARLFYKAAYYDRRAFMSWEPTE